MADDRPADITAHVSSVTAVDLNWLKKHAVPVFTTTALRDASITAPTTGALCYLATGSNTTEGLYRYHATAGWIQAGAVHRCTSSTRPGTPFVGMQIFETDTYRTLIYYGATTGWALPWNTGWGLVGEATHTANTAVGTSVTTILSTASITLRSDRRYLVASSVYLASFAAGSAMTVTPIFTQDTTQKVARPLALVGVTDAVALSDSFYYTPATTNTNIHRLRASGSSAGTSARGDVAPSFLTITDVGPVSATPPGA